MKEHPIIFTGAMTIALMEGRKTVTRRTQGLGKINKDPDDWEHMGYPADNISPVGVPQHEFKHINGGYQTCNCPFGVTGDRLWIRESLRQTEAGIYYDCDNVILDSWPDDYCYRNAEYLGAIASIHMPRWACRTYREVLSVSPERLQSMTEEDAVREGFNPGHWTKKPPSALAWIETAWDAVFPENPWDSNPWVWRIEMGNIENRLQMSK